MKYLIALCLIATSINPAYSSLKTKISAQDALNHLFESDLPSTVKGYKTGHRIDHVFGSNSNIGSNLTPITESGTYQTPSTLQPLEVVSNNADDNPSGTGARKVLIKGIGADWKRVEEIVTMNGLTPVAAVNQYYRVTNFEVYETGTYATAGTTSHNSNITLRNAGAGVSWAVITTESGLGLSQAEIGVTSCAAGEEMYLLGYDVSVEANKPATIILFSRNKADQTTAPYGVMRARTLSRSVADRTSYRPDAPFEIFDCPADVGIMGSFSTGSGALEVRFEVLIEEEQ